MIDFWFREEPYSVLIKWKQGARQAAASLYVAGENNNKVVALPTLLKWSGKLLTRDPNCREAKLSGPLLVVRIQFAARHRADLPGVEVRPGAGHTSG